jgi:hypothetical protein
MYLKCFLKFFRVVIYISIPVFFWSFDFHPHHVGVIEIEFNSKKKELQVGCKWFADDLEDAIQKKYKIKRDLIHSVDSIRNDTLLMDYINSNILFTSDSVLVPLKCIGAEYEKGALWFYFVAQNFSQGKQLEFTNQALCDVLRDQTYIVHITNNEKRSTYKSNCTNKSIIHQW